MNNSHCMHYKLKNKLYFNNDENFLNKQLN